MGGEAWSCFARLPTGLIDERSASLTLNWLRAKPTLAGFQLKPSDIDVERYLQRLRLRRQALLVAAFLVAGSAGAVAADRLFSLVLFDDEATVFAAVWMTTSSLVIAIGFYVVASASVMRFRSAEPMRIAFGAACMEFERIDAWRVERCEPRFWRDGLDDAGFELEAAELLAGHLGTGQVMLTREGDDYGVDVLVCSPAGRIVAQCKQWKGARIGAAQVRALAGARAFFSADRALLISLEGPAGEREQCENFAASQKLELWNLDAIVAAARRLRNGNGQR